MNHISQKKEDLKKLYKQYATDPRLIHYDNMMLDVLSKSNPSYTLLGRSAINTKNGTLTPFYHKNTQKLIDQIQKNKLDLINSEYKELFQCNIS